MFGLRSLCLSMGHVARIFVLATRASKSYLVILLCCSASHAALAAPATLHLQRRAEFPACCSQITPAREVTPSLSTGAAATVRSADALAHCYCNFSVQMT